MLKMFAIFYSRILHTLAIMLTDSMFMGPFESWNRLGALVWERDHRLPSCGRF